MHTKCADMCVIADIKRFIPSDVLKSAFPETEEDRITTISLSLNRRNSNEKCLRLYRARAEIHDGKGDDLNSSKILSNEESMKSYKSMGVEFFGNKQLDFDEIDRYDSSLLQICTRDAAVK